MTYLTFDSLMAFRLPDPITKDVEVRQLGGKVRIEGVVTRAELKEINDAIDRFREAVSGEKLIITHPVSGKSFKPTFSDVVAACWLAKCVTEPKLTALQWLQFSGEGFKFLPILFNDCMVCSRQEEDKDADIPEGVDAAEKQLEGDGPLEPSATH